MSPLSFSKKFVDLFVKLPLFCIVLCFQLQKYLVSFSPSASSFTFDLTAIPSIFLALTSCSCILAYTFSEQMTSTQQQANAFGTMAMKAIKGVGEEKKRWGGGREAVLTRTFFYGGRVIEYDVNGME